MLLNNFKTLEMNFLQDNAKSLEEVIACYPKMSSIDPSGKEMTEVMNKYFLMFQVVIKKTAPKKLDFQKFKNL